MNKFRILVAALISLVLNGCGPTPKVVKPGDVLNKSEGVVVTQLRSNWEGYKNPLLTKLGYIFGKSDSNINSGNFFMDRADDLKVVSLPAGDYVWSHLSFGNRRLDFNSEDHFTVMPNKIVYIGTLNAELDLGLFSASAKVTVENDIESITKQLNKEYPELMKNYQLVEKLTELNPK
jgi:hypothetical protein